MLAPVHEPVARQPLLFLAHILRSSTCTIGSPIAPVVSPTDWHRARSSCCTASWAVAFMRPHSAASNCAFYSRRRPRRLANSPLKKARHCLQHLLDLYTGSRREVCVCPVMCLDFGLFLEHLRPVRENAGVVPLALSLCHQQKPMPECAVPMIALLMSKRSPHLPDCQRYNFSFSTAVGTSKSEPM